MTTDADAYQRLTRALDVHRGDAEAYRRLGEQMIARRHFLGAGYGNRKLFVRERLVPLGLQEAAGYKLVYDMENGKLQGRGGFSAGNMLVLAQAYDITPDDEIAVLDGGELNMTQPVPAPPAAIPEPGATRSESMIGMIADAADEKALEPFLQAVRAELAEATRKHGPQHTGAQAFAMEHEIGLWDSPRLTLEEKERAIAALRLFAHEGAAESDRTGARRA